MNRYLLHIIYVVSIVFLVSSSIFSQRIVGPIEVCSDNCYNYYFKDGYGGPYQWQSSDSLDITKMSNNGDSVVICYPNNVHSNSILVIDNSAPLGAHLTFLWYKILRPIYLPIFFFSKDVCYIQSSIRLKEESTAYVCEGSTSFFSISKYNNQRSFLKVKNGIIVNTDTYGDSIRWDKVGKDSLINIYGFLPECMDSIIYPIEVLSKEEIEILGSDSQRKSEEVCVGQEITLSANTNDSLDFKWEVSDGRVFYGKTIDISFYQIGDYQIKLINTTICNCSKPSYYSVIVKSGKSPQIECTGTLCQGQEATYYSSEICDSNIWYVSDEGTIIAGGGIEDDFVKVVWNGDSSGEISLTNPGCFEQNCFETTTVEIPIIVPDEKISGNNVVCKGGSDIYSISNYTGTKFQWTITGNGEIISGQGESEIEVEWGSDSKDSIAIIEVNYDNCYLGCEGYSKMKINLLDRFRIDYGSREQCFEETAICTTEGRTKADWIIITPLGISKEIFDTNKISIEIDEIGNYKVKAVSLEGKYCNEFDEFEIEGLPVVHEPKDLEGFLFVCKNQLEVYSVSNLGAFDEVIWKVFDGDSITFSITSKELNYTWVSEGPYRIEASILNTKTGCISDITTYYLHGELDFIGPNEVCLGSEEEYTADVSQPINLVWEIVPVTAGTITSPVGSNTLKVVWKNSGEHKVVATYCNESFEYKVKVFPRFNINISYPSYICHKSRAKVIVKPPENGKVTIKDTNGNIKSTSITSYLRKGRYKIIVENHVGCIETTSITINEYKKPTITIYTNGPKEFCPPHPKIRIKSQKGSGTYKYAWYRDNDFINETSSSILTNTFGSYRLSVIDQNGCRANSNLIILKKKCNGGSGGKVKIVEDSTNISCSNLKFSLISTNAKSTTFTWNFDDPDSGTRNISHTKNPIHFFTHAGFFHVTVQGNIASERASLTVKILVVPKFENEDVCLGTVVKFKNLSTHLPEVKNIKYHWDFGDPLSGNLNTSSSLNPTHKYEKVGIYRVILKIEDVDGCIPEFHKNVQVGKLPVFTPIIPDVFCSKDDVKFSIETSDHYYYRWNFGDPDSGYKNKSHKKNPKHTYTKNGKYDISLEVSDFYGCTVKMDKKIKIRQNTLKGAIKSDIIFPKCPNQMVNLTAPDGSYFHWSNGDTIRKITVTDAGTYSVTVSDKDGCEYVAKPIEVRDYFNNDVTIRGYTYDNFNPESNTHFDSLEVCSGEKFFLDCTNIPQSNYQWSNGAKKRYLYYDEFLKDLTPGRYEFFVEVEESTYHCKYIADDFIVKINPNPDTPRIYSDNPLLCEGQYHKIKIQVTNDSLQYKWQNDKIGDSFIATTVGTYSVISKNKYGCETKSNELEIHQTPKISGWMTGCLKTCFPEDFCVDISNSDNVYKILHNGIEMQTINNSVPEFVLDEPGDYQLLVTNSYNCADTSAYLTLTALPDSQALSGIVYYDKNENSIFDLSDIVLKDVPVKLKYNDTIIDSTLTDNEGKYEFLAIGSSEMIAVIDVSNLPYLLKGSIDSLLEYSSCLEEKILDFPLISNCHFPTASLTFYVCPGDYKTYNGVDLFPGTKDTFTYKIADNCDSTVIVDIISYDETKIDIDISSSCLNSNTGYINIHKLSGDSLMYKIDDFDLYQEDSLYENLLPGNHSLHIIDKYGCENNTEFFIPTFSLPKVKIKTNVSCENQKNGSLNIDLIEGDSINFALDSSTNFTSTNSFNNLIQGSHVLWIKDKNDCLDSLYFQIQMIPMPVVDITTESFCEDMNMGSFSIKTKSEDLKFSLDGIEFKESYSFDDLTIGDYTLYAITKEECIFEFPVKIDGSFVPDLVLESNMSCEGQNNGILQIDALGAIDLKFSIDNNLFENTIEYSNLKPGNYTLFVETVNMCKYEYPFVIEETPLPIINTVNTNTCPSKNEGVITINTERSDLLYSVNNQPFSKKLEYPNLSPGEYSIHVIDSFNCENLFVVEILEYTKLSVDFPEYNSDCNIQEVFISPKISSSYGTLKYLWSDGTSDSVLLVRQSGEYYLNVSDECDEIYHNWDIEIEKEVNQKSLYIPNVFSPEADGFNDCMKVTPDKDLKLLDYHISIYDRWGELMYESDDINACWDGTFNGKKVQTAVFVYVIDLTAEQCDKPKNVRIVGDITVFH